MNDDTTIWQRLLEVERERSERLFQAFTEFLGSYRQIEKPNPMKRGRRAKRGVQDDASNRKEGSVACYPNDVPNASAPKENS
jgi:hypothetical protein